MSISFAVLTVTFLLLIFPCRNIWERYSTVSKDTEMLAPQPTWEPWRQWSSSSFCISFFSVSCSQSLGFSDSVEEVAAFVHICCKNCFSLYSILCPVYLVIMGITKRRKASVYVAVTEVQIQTWGPLGAENQDTFLWITPKGKSDANYFIHFILISYFSTSSNFSNL